MLISLIALRKGNKEGLLSFLERFKSKRNIVISFLGNIFINGYVESTQENQDIPDGDTAVQLQL